MKSQKAGRPKLPYVVARAKQGEYYLLDRGAGSFRGPYTDAYQAHLAWYGARIEPSSPRAVQFGEGGAQ